MRQRHSCISHEGNVDHNALRSWHAPMYKFVTSMVRCGLGMQQCAMHTATIQKTTFFELGVYKAGSSSKGWITPLFSEPSLDLTKTNNFFFCTQHIVTIDILLGIITYPDM